jgi:hypothetical protein
MPAHTVAFAFLSVVPEGSLLFVNLNPKAPTTNPYRP